MSFAFWVLNDSCLINFKKQVSVVNYNYVDLKNINKKKMKNSKNINKNSVMDSLQLIENNGQQQ